MPLYIYSCPKCVYKEEVIGNYNSQPPLCIFCDVPMKRGIGSIAFWHMPGEPQGSTEGTRKYAEEITKKTRR